MFRNIITTFLQKLKLLSVARSVEKGHVTYVDELAGYTQYPISVSWYFHFYCLSCTPVQGTTVHLVVLPVRSMYYRLPAASRDYIYTTTTLLQLIWPRQWQPPILGLAVHFFIWMAPCQHLLILQNPNFDASSLFKMWWYDDVQQITANMRAWVPQQSIVSTALNEMYYAGFHSHYLSPEQMVATRCKEQLSPSNISWLQLKVIFTTNNTQISTYHTKCTNHDSYIRLPLSLYRSTLLLCFSAISIRNWLDSWLGF